MIKQTGGSNMELRPIDDTLFAKDYDTTSVATYIKYQCEMSPHFRSAI